MIQTSPLAGASLHHGAPSVPWFEHLDPLAGEDRGPVGGFVRSGLLTLAILETIGKPSQWEK